MPEFFDNIFSEYQCGFRKGYSAQHCLLVMIEKWKKVVDNDVLSKRKQRVKVNETFSSWRDMEYGVS